MSNTNVEVGATETQHMRIIAPVGVSYFEEVIIERPVSYNTIFLQSAVRLRLRISYTIAGQNFQDQVDFAGFSAGLTNGGSS